MCESPVDRDAPVMLAWNTFKATEEYANAARWALSPEDTEGSLWRAFLEGYTAAASAPPADAAPLTSDFHTSCDWCKRDIPNACYAVLCSDCDRRGNTALFAPPADAAETPGTNKVEASDGDRDHKGADLKQDGGGNAADGEGPALLGVQQADGALPDGAAGRVLLAVSVLRGGAADRSVAPPADAATEALSRQFIEELRQRAYGPGKWSNDLEGDFGTWEAWRAALVEFAGRSRDAEGGGRG